MKDFFIRIQWYFLINITIQMSLNNLDMIYPLKLNHLLCLLDSKQHLDYLLRARLFIIHSTLFIFRLFITRSEVVWGKNINSKNLPFQKEKENENFNREINYFRRHHTYWLKCKYQKNWKQILHQEYRAHTKSKV